MVAAPIALVVLPPLLRIQAPIRYPPPGYVVCPHTVIKVGVPSTDYSTLLNGDWPLVALGPNVVIKHGSDGLRPYEPMTMLSERILRYHQQGLLQRQK